MRWIIVSQQSHPSHGGIGAAVQQFVHAAADAGWHVQLITRAGREHPRGAHVHELETLDQSSSFDSWVRPLRRIERIRPYRYGLWSLAAAQKLLELKVDADAVEFVDCQAEGYVALTSARVRRHCGNAAMIVSAHAPMWLHEANAGLDLSRFGRRIYHHWERQAVQAAHAVMAPSAALLRKLEFTGPTLVLPPPMRAVAAAPPPSRRQIALIGPMQPQKGVDTWVRSLNRVLRERSDAAAVLVGPDTPTAPDGLSMSRHVLSLLQPPLRSRLRYVGPLPHEATMQVVEQSALIVVPSLFESFSFVAAEAIMRGRPVIASNAVGLAEHLPQLATVPPGDITALAEAQLAILDDVPGACSRALALRDDLIKLCDPISHLARRREFVERLRRRDHASSTPDLDAVDAMNQMLRDIERQAMTPDPDGPAGLVAAAETGRS